jgi:hypothetical protein
MVIRAAAVAAIIVVVWYFMVNMSDNKSCESMMDDDVLARVALQKVRRNKNLFVNKRAPRAILGWINLRELEEIKLESRARRGFE